MKLLVVSHGCVTALNQAFYAEVALISGWNVDLVLPARWNTEYTANVEPTRWEEFEGQILKIPVFNAGNIPLHIYKRTMISLLLKVRPDMIYVHHEPYGVATAQVYLANLLSIRVPIGFYAAQNIYKKYPVPFRWFEQLVLGHSDFSFPVTEGALQLLRTKGYKGRAEVLPLGLDTTVYYPRPEWSANKRRDLGIDSGTFVFGYIGRLVEEKGLRSALKAAALLGTTAWHCILVGNGSDELRLRQLVVELGLSERVTFLGFVPHEHVPGWLSLFDVLLLPSLTMPSWKEQFGRVIVEANACETAVIGTSSGEIPNVLSDTGGGIVVPEDSPDALSSAMRYLLEHRRKTQELALTGAAAVRQKYDQKALAGRMVESLTQVFHHRKA